MDEDEEGLFEGSGLTGRMIVEALAYLFLDVVLVYVLWNHALVGAIEGVHQIGILAALGIIFLARSISRG